MWSKVGSCHRLLEAGRGVPPLDRTTISVLTTSHIFYAIFMRNHRIITENVVVVCRPAGGEQNVCNNHGPLCLVWGPHGANTGINTDRTRRKCCINSSISAMRPPVQYWLKRHLSHTPVFNPCSASGIASVIVVLRAALARGCEHNSSGRLLDGVSGGGGGGGAVLASVVVGC